MSTVRTGLASKTEAYDANKCPRKTCVTSYFDYPIREAIISPNDIVKISNEK